MNNKKKEKKEVGKNIRNKLVLKAQRCMEDITSFLIIVIICSLIIKCYNKNELNERYYFYHQKIVHNQLDFSMLQIKRNRVSFHTL